MELKNDDTRGRFGEMEFEVPGTPEQVWRAIATGPGISSWLFPTELEEREGGAVAFHIAPGMESAGTVTAWEPPRRIAYEEPDWNPGAPPLGTEFVIEAKSGGTCVVRLVHSLFTSSEEWDDQFGSFETGWTSCFRVLRLVLAHFADQPSESFRVLGDAPGSEGEVWATLAEALGVRGAAPGEQRGAPDSAPPLAGVVERAEERETAHEVMLRLEKPVPGIGVVGAYTWGGKAHPSLSFFFFGDEATRAKAQAEPAWRAWFEERFPSSKEKSAAS